MVVKTYTVPNTDKASSELLFEVFVTTIKLLEMGADDIGLEDAPAFQSAWRELARRGQLSVQ